MVKNSIRVAISVMLVVAVLAMSLSVFAEYSGQVSDETTFSDWYTENGVTGEDAEDAWGALGIYGIWATLNGFGIEVSVDDVSEWSTEIYNTMYELVGEYLDSIPSMNYTKWILPWQFGFTSSGLFQGNNTMLEDVEDFAEWLEQKFGWSDNSTVTLNSYKVIPVVDEDGIEIYIHPHGAWVPQINEWRANIYNYMPDGFLEGSIYHLLSGYYCQVRRDNGLIHFYISSNADMSNPVKDMWMVYVESFDATYDNPLHTGTAYEFNGTHRIPVTYCTDTDSDRTSQQYWFAAWASYSQWDNGITQWSSINQLSREEVERYFFPQDLSSEIQTGTVIFPSEDSDYTSGDMYVIDNGDVYYLSVEFPDSISVDNLPAIVSTGTVTNPSLETFWGFIPVLADQTKDAIALTRGLIYELPEELVVTFYAVMGGLVLFGIIKLMREH